MTYKHALLQAVLLGVILFVVIAAGPRATIASAMPYGVGAAVVVGLFLCGFVAYRNGQPNKQ
jgi:hypothetical protein